MHLSRVGRHSRAGAAPELVYRSIRPPVRPVRQPARQIIHNTVHQTVVHLHQTTHQRIFNRVTTGGSNTTELVVHQAPAHPVSGDGIDPSRPALVAGKLLRVLSTESAQKVVQPYFSRMVQRCLEQEREIWQIRPSEPAPAPPPGLSGAEFQALVRSVTDAIDRRNRRNLLRRGGNG